MVPCWFFGKVSVELCLLPLIQTAGAGWFLGSQQPLLYPRGLLAVFPLFFLFLFIYFISFCSFIFL